MGPWHTEICRAGVRTTGVSAKSSLRNMISKAPVTQGLLFRVVKVLEDIRIYWLQGQSFFQVPPRDAMCLVNSFKEYQRRSNAPGRRASFVPRRR